MKIVHIDNKFVDFPNNKENNHSWKNFENPERNTEGKDRH